MDKYNIKPYDFKPSALSKVMTTKDLAIQVTHKLREIFSNQLGVCVEVACDANKIIMPNETRFSAYIVFDYSTAAEEGKCNATISTSSALMKKSTGMHAKITGMNYVATGRIATLSDQAREFLLPYMFENMKSVKDSRWENHIKCVNGPGNMLQVIVTDINICKMLCGFVYPDELVYEFVEDENGVIANTKKVAYAIKFINNKLVNSVYGVTPDEHVYNIEVSAYFKEIVDQEFAEIYPMQPPQYTPTFMPGVNSFVNIVNYRQ